MKVGTWGLYKLAKGKSEGVQRPALVVALSDRRGGMTVRVFDAGITDAGSELEDGGFTGVVHGVGVGDGPGQFSIPGDGGE